VAARTEFKEGLMRRLIAGDVRLAEVAAVYLQLHAGDAVYEQFVRAHYPAPTLAASVAQCVIGTTRQRIDDPDRVPGVLARLAAEYEAEYGSPPRRAVE
jgi:hypothetical protein